MSWWARRNLRTKIFLAFSSLILAVLLATLGFTQLVVSRDAKRTLSRELLTTGQVFLDLMRERAARLKSNSVLLASDFGLKRVIGTYDPETLASAALSYQERIGVELFWITDESGVLLTVSQQKADVPRSIASFPPVHEALRTQQPASVIAEVNGTLFQVVAVPVFGPDVIGFLVLGHVIDDALATRLKEETGSDISFVTDTRVFASSLPGRKRGLAMASGQRRAQLLRASTRTSLLLDVGNERVEVLPRRSVAARREDGASPSSTSSMR